MKYKGINILYCDGGCRNNQAKENIGGYGGIILYYDGRYREYIGSQKNVTNNIMELLAAIKGLNELSKDDHIKDVIVFTDSKYVVDGYERTINNDFKRADGKTVANEAYWRRLYSICKKFPSVEFQHVKGHSDNEYNIRADMLCNRAMDELVYLESQK